MDYISYCGLWAKVNTFIFVLLGNRSEFRPHGLYWQVTLKIYQWIISAYCIV